MDNIIERLSVLKIAHLATTLPPASNIETLEKAVNQLTLNDTGNLSPPTHSAPDISIISSFPDGDLKRLSLLDEKLDSHLKSIILCLDALSSPSSQDQVEVNLSEEKRWLQDSIRELHGLESHCDADIRIFAEAMHDRMAQFTAAVDMYIEILRDRSPLQSSPHVVHTGAIVLPIHLPSKNLIAFFRSVLRQQFARQAHCIPCRRTKCCCSESLWARDPYMV